MANALRLHDVYLAAPFFCRSENCLNEEVVDALELIGLSVFYPPRDGPLAQTFWEEGFGVDEMVQTVWHCDRGAIERSRVVLAVLDGRTTDEGVCVELGFSAALGVRSVGLCTDVRKCFEWGMNPVLQAVVGEVLPTIDRAVDSVRKICTECEGSK